MEWMDRMLVFGPDEGGGGGTEEVETEAAETTETPEEETFEVEGEKLSKAEVLRRAANEKKLAGEYTRSRQETAELRGRMDELSRRVNTTPGATPEPEKAPDFTARIKALDPYAPGYQGELATILDERDAWNQKQIDAKVQASQEASQGQLSNAERARAIDDANRELLDRVITDPDLCPVKLTREEEAELREDFQRHVSGPYGTYDATAQRFRRTEAAAVAALHAVPSIRAKILAFHTAKARQEGYEGRAKGQEAGRSAPGATPRPGTRATFEDQVKWLEGAGKEARQEYLREHPEFRDKFKRYDLEQRRSGNRK